MARAVIAQQLLIETSPIYFDTQQQVLDEQLATVTKGISDRVGEIVTMTQEKQKRLNEKACLNLETDTDKPSRHGTKKSAWTSEVFYDAATNECVKRWIHWTRNGPGIAYNWNRDEKKDRERRIKMPELTRADLRGQNKPDDATDSSKATSTANILNSYTQDSDE